MYVVLIGSPGSGKGTQAKTLSERSGLVHVASGDLFREAVGNNTPLGRKANYYMEQGELVPDSITVAMVTEHLRELEDGPGAILDGFPRTVAQARALDEALAEQGRKIDRAVYLKVPAHVLLARLSGRWICRSCQMPFHEIYRPPATPGQCDYCGDELYQRPDDARETAERRLEVYFESTLPVIEYYQERSVLIEVNGDQDVEQVRAHLLRALEHVKP